MLKTSSSSFYRIVSLASAPRIRHVSSFRPTRRKINTPGVAVHRLLPKYRHRARLLKINRVLLHVDHLLSKQKWADAWLYFHSKLSPLDESRVGTGGRAGSVYLGLDTNSDRFIVYENAISLFASYRRFDEALEIHNRMQDEGFIPTLSLRTKLTVYMLVQEKIDADAIFKTLEEAFQDPSYSEYALLQLIRFLSDILSFSPKSVDHIVQLWSKHHGTISSPTTLAYLVYIHTRNGILEAAQNWLQIHANEAAERGQSPDPAPYTSFLSTLARVPNPTGHLSQTLTQMRNDGVAPDVAVFNALISSQIAHHQVDKAFQTYGLLYGCRSSSFTPDAFTFSSLFKALNLRRRPRPEVKQNIRDLYNNLLECHLIQTKGRLTPHSTTLNSSVLNNALETFMAYRDYPAAYVILQSFRQCGLHANIETCRVVVKSLLQRVRKESRLYSGMVGRTWVGRFLGRGLRKGVDVNENVFALSDEEIIDRILLDASSPPSKTGSQESGSFDVAKRSLLRPAVFSDKIELGSVLPHFDLVLLRRMVQRAFSADVTNRYHLAYQLGEESIISTKAFSVAMVEAKNVMIPDVNAVRKHFISAKLEAQAQVTTTAEGRDAS